MRRGSVGLGGGALWFAALAFAVSAAGCLQDSSTGESKGAAGSNPSADLDQCANGPLDAPVDCTGSAWVNGNLNHNQAHYLEHDSVPYRMKFGNLSTTESHSVRIEWDTSENGHHATDYLTTFDRTEATADPCSGIAGCSLGSYSSFTVPVDALVAVGPDDSPGTADDIVPEAGEFRLFGGTITDVSGYTIDGTYDGSSQTSIVITFTASVANPVLAWGGHISLRYDWDPEPTAVAIPGSPFHMRLLDLDGSGGNQDRSLAASAVFFPPELIVIKHVINDNGGTAVASDFIMTVTGVNPTPGSFPGAEDPGTVVKLEPGAYSVTESGPDGYEATLSADCSGTLDYDQTATCTITNDDVNRCENVVCDPESECVNAGVCDPATGLCVYDPKPEGTACSDDELPCTSDVCDADGACVHPPGNQGFECRASAGDCDPAELCDGESPTCPGDVLSHDMCRASQGDCDPAEFCDGESPVCPGDVLSHDMCRASQGDCDPAEYCDGASPVCPGDVLSHDLCRASQGDCDPAEYCDGASPTCPGDVLSHDVCRASQGDCDPAEYCDGDSPTCPGDVLSHDVCRASQGDCDPAEYCDGDSPTCPGDVLSHDLCRASQGDCDPAEYCDGDSPTCPGDVLSHDLCRASQGDCDPAEYCDGDSPTCPGDVLSHDVCRASQGDCDPAEYCDGDSPTCPGDVLSHDMCRESQGDCDPAEYCDGDSPTCPGDLLSHDMCRESQGDCDPAEYCDGDSPTCPGDLLSHDMCRESQGDCDPAEYCDGESPTCPGDLLSHDMCRESQGDCDPAEYCDGVGADCPPDYLSNDVCRPSAGFCDVPESCDGENPACPQDDFLPAATECRPSADTCDPAEFCTGNDAACPDDVAGTCELCGSKFYDANANATWDDGENGLAAWKISVTDSEGVTVSTTTDVDGVYLFDSLATGDYTVCEEYPLQSNWMQTAPLQGCYSVSIPTAHGLCMYDFGNLCFGPGGGHTPGYWSNKNGMADFVGPTREREPLSLMFVQSYNLRDDSGASFDPASYGEFAEWLLDGTAVNMAYKLSTQLAAMALNVRFQYVDGYALVFAPGASNATSLGFISVFDLMAEADAELGLHGLSPEGSPYRAYQEALKNALDAANNNRNFVQSDACAFSFDSETDQSELEVDQTNTTTTRSADDAEEPSVGASDEAPAAALNEGGCSAGGSSSPWGATLFAALLLGFVWRRRRN